MAIDVSLSSEQELIQQSARDFFAAESTIAAVRKAEAADEEFPRALWGKMSQMGWLGMGFPEEFGGAGCPALDLYPIYIEAGRHLAPVPLLDCVGFAGALIAAAGNEAQKKALLPEIAAGRCIVSCAVMESEGVYGPRGIKLAATASGNGYTLNGTKVLVPWVKSASKLIVAARTGGKNGPKGVTLLLVDPKAGGVSVEATKTMTGERMYAVTFNKVSVAADSVLGEVDAGWKPLDEAQLRAGVLQAGIVVGAGERVLEMTADYAKNRVQFGKPIGSYQAVQYLVTDIAVDLHLARLLALQAAWKLSSSKKWQREAALAKAQANKAAVAMIHGSHETHAGIGFMLDYDLQLYTRRAKHWEYNLGDTRYHIDRSLTEAGI
jgi:alkylation response protein AidB-like acyl-CoA dehydrogenase